MKTFKLILRILVLPFGLFCTVPFIYIIIGFGSIIAIVAALSSTYGFLVNDKEAIHTGRDGWEIVWWLIQSPFRFWYNFITGKPIKF